MRVAHDTFLEIACATMVVVALGACRPDRSNAAANRDGATTSAGGEAAPSVAMRPFHGDPQQARLGRYLFVRDNCYGCHGGLAGGAMGPSLRDTVWKYGGSDQQIYASIHDGRPMGMPTWGSSLTPGQIRALVTYIRSLRTSAEPQFFFIGQMADSLGKQAQTLQ